MEITERPCPMSEWGKDHWSLLGYLYHCSANYTAQGGVFTIEHSRMRCHPSKALLNANRGIKGWAPENGTRLKGFFDTRPPDSTRRLDDHDDWDCLDDLEAAGLVEVVSLINGFVRITQSGLELGHQLYVHKASGGSFASFEPAL